MVHQQHRFVVVLAVCLPGFLLIKAAEGFLSHLPGRAAAGIRLSEHNNEETTTRLFGMDQARRLVAEGMTAFRQGQVETSIVKFDQAEQEEPRYGPYLWQRGLSYYYVNDFDKARRQFRTDVQVNPLDVEEIVWDIASALRGNPTSLDFPVTSALALPPNQRDRRPIMAIVYRLFRGQATEAELAQFGHVALLAAGGGGSATAGAGAGGAATFATSPPFSSYSLSDEFYSLFYLGLFAEARQEPTKAEHYLRRSIQTTYATSVGQADYMTAVAKVHCQLRGWV